MKRRAKLRRRPKIPIWQSALGFHILLWLVVFISAIGFTYYALEVIRLEHYFTLDVAKPYGLTADGFLAVGLVALAIILLSGPEPHYEASFKRIKSLRAWLLFRPDIRGVSPPSAFRSYKTQR